MSSDPIPIPPQPTNNEEDDDGKAIMDDNHPALGCVMPFTSRDLLEHSSSLLYRPPFSFPGQEMEEASVVPPAYWISPSFPLLGEENRAMDDDTAPKRRLAHHHHQQLPAGLPPYVWPTLYEPQEEVVEVDEYTTSIPMTVEEVEEDPSLMELVMGVEEDVEAKNKKHPPNNHHPSKLQWMRGVPPSFVGSEGSSSFLPPPHP
jgi:hypothetical protein